MEISQEIHVYCVHTISAIIMPINHRDSIYLEIMEIAFTSMTSIVQVFSELMHVTFFSLKSSEKAHYTKNFLKCM